MSMTLPILVVTLAETKIGLAALVTRYIGDIDS